MKERLLVSMIERLKLTNFKSIGNKPVTIDFKPLTILTGPNGSGKSSILEAIATISQTVRLQSLPKTLERGLANGEFVKFPSLESARAPLLNGFAL